MNSSKQLKFEMFGTSHSEFIGIHIDNFPKDFKINKDEILHDLERRRPDGNISTSRIEKDDFSFLSGIKDDITTGERITVIVKNEDVRSSDYKRNILRPNHADYTSYIKTNELPEAGGGKFSGRLTVLLVIMGSLCKQYLKLKDIHLGTFINNIGQVKVRDEYVHKVTKEAISKINEEKIACQDYALKQQIIDEIIKTKQNLDSVGGSISTYIINLPKGIGDAYFGGVESYLSYLVFAVPAVKAVSFGYGERFKDSFGSDVLDEYYFENDEIKLYNNFNGGLLGGITTGEALVVNTTFKPTPTIGKKVKTVNLETKENIEHSFTGRHDPCIVIRACVVVESVLAYGVLSLLLKQN